MEHIKSHLHASLDPLQFTYRANRRISIHPDPVNSLQLGIQYYLATTDPGLPYTEKADCENWQQNIEHHHSEHRITSGVSPLLFTLLTRYCFARSNTDHMIKFADDTTLVGLIRNEDECTGKRWSS